jgi:hypothetical protein
MHNALTKSLRAIHVQVTKFFDQLREALCDDRREGTVALLLAGYAFFWTLYDVMSRHGEGIHHDMGEMVAWSHDLALGSPKHPQMGAWIAGLWFSVFPQQDWAFYLLANVLIAITLWFAWLLTENRLSDDKRVAGLAFLMLVPFFNFFAWKYNANTILIPLWAATTYFFIRSMETRAPVMAALAGFAAAAAMMGKYWSIFLLAGLAIAALFNPQRREYFRSSAPWITILAGVLAIAPHLYWVASHHFVTLDYALEGHRAGTLFNSLEDAGIYLSGAAAYLALPVFLLIWFARPKFAALLDTFWPQAGARRFFARGVLAADPAADSRRASEQDRALRDLGDARIHSRADRPPVLAETGDLAGRGPQDSGGRRRIHACRACDRARACAPHPRSWRCALPGQLQAARARGDEGMEENERRAAIDFR